MKKVMMCDDHAYHIEDEDFERLKRVSPAFARVVRESDRDQPTHFVCEGCGQISPVKLRGLHRCR